MARVGRRPYSDFDRTGNCGCGHARPTGANASPSRFHACRRSDRAVGPVDAERTGLDRLHPCALDRRRRRAERALLPAHESDCSAPRGDFQHVRTTSRHNANQPCGPAFFSANLIPIRNLRHLKSLRFRDFLLVGARGFEPPTPCSRSRCATRLRYAPTVGAGLNRRAALCKGLAPRLMTGRAA